MSTLSHKAPPPVTRAVNLCMREDVRNLINHAARTLGRTRSDFMIKAARQAAEDVLLDQTFIQVDTDTYEQFLAILDQPSKNEGYKRLMRTPKPWIQIMKL